MRTRTITFGTALALTAVGALATAGLAASPGTMPAAAPTDARAANLSVFTTTVPTRRLGGRANSYFYFSNGGGAVRIARAATRRFTSYQKITVTPPSGATILQGFATISGGQTGSMVLRSTASAPSRYTVRVAMPGEQGRPGRLTIRIQVINRA